MRRLHVILFAVASSCLLIPEPAGGAAERDQVLKRAPVPAALEPADAAAAQAAAADAGTAIEPDVNRQVDYSCLAAQPGPAHAWGRVDVSAAIRSRLSRLDVSIGTLTVSVFAPLNYDDAIAIRIDNNGGPESSVWFGEFDHAGSTSARALSQMFVYGHHASSFYNCIPIRSWRGFFYIQQSI